MVAFDIVQFFPSLNHELIIDTIELVGFLPKIVKFFSNYLTDRYTIYIWNYFSLSPFPASIGVGQGSTLFPVLLTFYFALILHLFKMQASSFDFPFAMSTFFFVDNSFFIS